MVGQRLEHAQVVLDELAHLRESVRHEQGSGGDPFGDQGHDGCVLDADLGQPAGQRLPGLVQAGLPVGQKDRKVGGQLRGRDVAAEQALALHEHAGGGRALTDRR
jgi:hypothetical protein